MVSTPGKNTLLQLLSDPNLKKMESCDVIICQIHPSLLIISKLISHSNLPCAKSYLKSHNVPNISIQRITILPSSNKMLNFSSFMQGFLDQNQHPMTGVEIPSVKFLWKHLECDVIVAKPDLVAESQPAYQTIV